MNLKKNIHPINRIKAINSHHKKKISLICKDNLNNDGCFINFKILLEELNYIVEKDENNPDFLIFDVFGCEHVNTKYNNSIKIAYYSENIIPDFSEVDYSISQAHLIYFDRYFKYPSFIHKLDKLGNLKMKCIGQFARKYKKTKFCGAVISNCKNITAFRLKFIEKLNKYKHVDMGGKCLNDFGRKVENKIDYLSGYKFSISMENTNGDGYISEKIVDSLIAGTIPIYYGDYLIDEYINPKVYILIKDEKDINAKIEYIKRIDEDKKLYKSILKEKIFLNDNYKNIIKKAKEENLSFLNNISFI